MQGNAFIDSWAIQLHAPLSLLNTYITKTVSEVSIILRQLFSWTVKYIIKSLLSVSMIWMNEFLKIIIMEIFILTNLQIIWNTLQIFEFDPVWIIFIHFFICMHTLQLIYSCVHICVYWKNNKVFWKCKLTERVSVCDTCAMRQYQSFEFFLQSGLSIHCSCFYGCDIVLFSFFHCDIQASDVV